VTSETQPARRPPGRPRSAAADEAILTATLELLAEDGYGGLSMEAVRLRSGVGKATIYRRWKSKQELVADAVRHLNQDLRAPDTGSLVGDFAGFARAAGESAGRLNFQIVAARLLAEAANEPELHRIFYENLVERRRAAIKSVIERAQERGEVRADVDLDIAVDLIVGPMLYRALIALENPAELAARAATYLGTALEGLRPR
jgi:AcrR family transcriptional regulator